MSDVPHPSSSKSARRSDPDEDESVRIAISALGDMRNSARAVPSSPATATSAAHPYPDASSPDFVSRVSHFPIVNTALKAYENTKASSRMVKYGAEMMESSVKTFYRPVLGRLPVDQLDEFACRQLDRLDKYRRPSSDSIQPESSRPPSDPGVARDDHDKHSGLDNRQSPPSKPDLNTHEYIADEDAMSAISPPPLTTTESRTPTPQTREDSDRNTSRAESQQQIVQRSRWQSVLLEAGGIGAAVSEESMRRLKYCLQCLQFATEHIDGQILILRDFIVSLQSTTNGAPSHDALISPSHLRTLTEIRRDVVQTIRQVVDVVSKYAGGALPEPARSRVRGFILHLPQRWANATQGLAGSDSSRPSVPSHGTSSAAEAASSGGGSGGATRRGRQARQAQHRERGTTTPASSRPPSPLSSPRVKPRTAVGSGTVAPGGGGVGGSPTASSATQAAQRILTLATESLDMMRGVTTVMKESLDRADAWVERLRIVGIQRGQIPERALGESESENRDMLLPPPPPPPSSSSSDAIGFSSASTSPSSSTLAHRRKHSLPYLSSSASTSAVSTPAQETPYSSVPTTPVELFGSVNAGQGPTLPPLASLSLGGSGMYEGGGARGMAIVVEEKKVRKVERAAMDVDG